MDKQAMDRCHRIGQTREVNIYRLISESTIEENIFKKQLEKRQLDEIVIDGGSFTPDALKNKWSSKDVLGIFSGGDSSVFGSTVLWKQEKLADDLSGAMTAVEDQEDVAALSAAMKEEKLNAHVGEDADFVNEEEKAFNRLPGIVKYGVSLFEEIMEFEEDEEDEDENDVEIEMGSWDSDDGSGDGSGDDVNSDR
jgi:helicase SWR1